MSRPWYLIVHADQPLEAERLAAPENSAARVASLTVGLARDLKATGAAVVVAAELPSGERVLDGIPFWNLGGAHNVSAVLKRAEETKKPYILVCVGRAHALLLREASQHAVARVFVSTPDVAPDPGIKLTVLDSYVTAILCFDAAEQGAFVSAGVSPQKVKLLAPGDLTKAVRAVEQGIENAGTVAARGSADPGKIGFLSTWNQQCGLATYAQYLVAKYPKEQVIVLAEDTTTLRRGTDEPFVRRCWNRTTKDYARLGEIIKRERISLLHINCHHRFFAQPEFGQFLNAARANGVRTVVHLHSIFAPDASLRVLVEQGDAVVVHGAESRLEAVACGADPLKVHVIDHGVESSGPRLAPGRLELKRKLGLPTDEKIIVSFGFIQPHKGMEGVIEAVAHLGGRGVSARGYILGRPNPDDPGSVQYAAQLRELARSVGVSDRIVFLERFLDESEVSAYLSASDLVLMNYRSQHFEASGACALAVGAGSVVATSLAPPFWSFGDAVWHITAGFPVAQSAELLLTNTKLSETLRAQARAYAERCSWSQIQNRMFALYRTLGWRPVEERAGEKEVAGGDQRSSMGSSPQVEVRAEREQVRSSENKRPEYRSDEVKGIEDRTKRGAGMATNYRVLMQNRKNLFSQRGGDTVVIEKLCAGLKSKGVEVMVDCEGAADPASFDVVHLFNFVLPEMIQFFGERAKRAGTPCVVTTLSEDVAQFHNQSIQQAELLREYVTRGQSAQFWEEKSDTRSAVTPAPGYNNEWAIKNAAALMTNGARETRAILRDYPGTTTIREVKLGYEVGVDASPDLFTKTYGLKDFIFCVGRLESRKNQLMLLKALEDVEIPLVLAAGGFTYQPEYAAAVRNFKRKGPTLILDKLSPEMLASAYRAARVHALPSWYELPGLVTLEAAFFGCNVVATENGTAKDYMGKHAFYCDPSSEAAVRNAVLAAYFMPVSPEIRETALQYTWHRTVEETLKVYEACAKEKRGAAPTIQTISRAITQPAWVPASSSPSPSSAGITSSAGNTTGGTMAVEKLIENAEEAAWQKNFALAHQQFNEAERQQPNHPRLLRAKGATLLAEGRTKEARSYFERALATDARDSRTITGLGMCDMNETRPGDAIGHFARALEIDPQQIIALRQLVACSYQTNRYGELETALRRYMTTHAQDPEMRFCLAGALYKQGKLSEALAECQEILRLKPDHVNARELDQKIARELVVTNGNAGRPGVQSTLTVKTVGIPPAPSFPAWGSSPASGSVTPASTTAWGAPLAGAPAWGAGAAVQGNQQSASPSYTVSSPPAWSPATPGWKTVAAPVPPAQPLSAPTVATASVGIANNVWSPSTAPFANPSNGVATTPFDRVDEELSKLEDVKRQKRFDDVKRVCREILANGSIRPQQREQAMAYEAEVAVLEGRLPDARAKYDEIMKLNPHSARGLCGRGALSAYDGNWGEAMKLFEQSRNIEPKYDVPLAGLGLCYAQKGDKERAWWHYEEALKVNSENTRALLGLMEVGYALGRLGRVEEALKGYLDLHPADLEFVYSLAGCLFAQSKLDEARTEIEKIKLFKPDHQHALELERMIAEKVTGPQRSSASYT